MQKVIGQTGTSVLSDEKIQYKLARKRTVRYWYMKCQHGYRAEVVGPFHSELYGACGFGTKKTSAKAALERNLANNQGYIGRLLFTTVDEADNVGRVDPRLLDENATSRPISNGELIGSAGQ
ncbi:MAG: hypothetical protein DRJ03_00880 [Chloroflexi bacterium]|nr:MAG: hypothetical protein DRJ03_00880 [Chloroflexota bacterium]